MDLREYLFQSNLTVAELARKLGVTRVYLHYCLKGSRIPSKELLTKISELTNGQITKFEQLVDGRFCGQKKDRNCDKGAGGRKKKE